MPAKKDTEAVEEPKQGAPADDAVDTSKTETPPGEVWVEAIEPLNKKGKTINPGGKTTLPLDAAKALEEAEKLKIIKE